MDDQENSKEINLLQVDSEHLKSLVYLEIDTNKNAVINQEDTIIKQYILSNENINQVFVLYGNRSVLIYLKSSQFNTPQLVDSIINSIQSEFGIYLNQKAISSHFFLTSEIDDAKLGLLSQDKSISLKLIESKTGLRLRKIKKKIYFSGYMFQFVVFEKMLSDYQNHVLDPVNEFTEWKDKYENSFQKFQFTVNQCQLYVFKADCSELNTDLIVNFTNPNLHPGYTGNGVSRRIREKAGKQMQECLKKILQSRQSNLQDSDLCETKASGKLKCKHVIHSVCPQWTQYVQDKILQPNEINLQKFEYLIKKTFECIINLTNDQKFSNCESIALGVSESSNGGSFDLPLEIFVHYLFEKLLDSKLNYIKKICLVALEDSTVVKMNTLFRDYSEQCATTKWALPESPLGRMVSKLIPTDQLSISCTEKEKINNSSNSPSSSSSSSSISPIRIAAKNVTRLNIRENHYYPICDGEIFVRKISEPCTGYERYRTVLITFEVHDGIQKDNQPKPGHPFKGLIKRAYLPDVKEHMEILAYYKKALKNGLLFKLEWSPKLQNFVVQLNNNVPLKTSLNSGGKFGYPDINYIDDILAKARSVKV